MAGDEVGVEMGLDDVLDAEVFLAGVVEVEIDVALGIDDGGDSFGGHDVGGVGKAAEKELFDDDWFHGFALVLKSTGFGSIFRFFSPRFSVLRTDCWPSSWF